jgi:hypothetical protein
MILHQKNLDYMKPCKYTFSLYIQGHNKPAPSNTNAARTLDCIYLQNRDSHQGGHELLHLPTNHVIIQRNITLTPITSAVIDQVSHLASSEHMPTGLKITNAMDQTLYNSTLFAGVEHDDNHNNDDNDNDNNDYNNNDNNKQIQVNQVNQVNDEMHPDNMEHGFKKQPTSKSSINKVKEDDKEEEEQENKDNIELQQESIQDEEEEEEPFDCQITM